MFKGQKVKIRLKRDRGINKTRVFIGKVINMNDNWLQVDGKFYTIAKGERKPRVDEQDRVVVIPRESIHIVRILPEQLNLDKLKYTVKDNRLVIELDDGQPASISE